METQRDVHKILLMLPFSGRGKYNFITVKVCACVGWSKADDCAFCANRESINLCLPLFTCHAEAEELNIVKNLML